MKQYYVIDPRKPPRRQYCTWHTINAINKGSCLHLDAYLTEDDDTQRLYFYVVASRGGWEGEIRKYIIWERGLDYVGNVASLPNGQHRVLGRTWSRNVVPWLREVHEKHILPLLWGPLDPMFKTRNIKLHYIWSDKRINEPTESLYNVYGVSNHAKKARERMSPATLAELERKEDEEFAKGLRGPVRRRGRPPSPWSRKDRSLLRTLDKLLKS